MPSSRSTVTSTRRVVKAIDPSWAPQFRHAWMFLGALRLLGALVNIINDCDEVYNYYEPTHYLLYGFGMQTWEYSPEYALRSYSYILAHASLAKLFRIVYDNKIMVFFLLRAALGVMSAFCEVKFYTAVKNQFGNRIGRTTLFFLAFGAGMFHAATSYLPATFAMLMLMLAFAYWMEGDLLFAILPCAAIGVCGWPFPAFIAVPMGLHMIAKKGIFPVLGACIAAVVLFIFPSILCDVMYFDKVVFPSWNTVMYNIMRGPEASALYGVDPWTYYVVNLGLNFNLIAVFGLLGPLVYLLALSFSPEKSSSRALAPAQRPHALTMLGGLSLWMALMWKLPHKEERFLFPIYPLLALSAALCLVISSDVIEGIGARLGQFPAQVAKTMSSLVNWTSVLIYLTISTTRIAALAVNFYAPVATYTVLSVMELSDRGEFRPDYPVPGQVNICTGKEWYRFPSSFFLPNERFQLQYIQSGFKGELPQPFAKVNGTGVILPHFNDMNREEPTRYIDVSQCHYLIDLDVPGQTETRYHTLPEWDIVEMTPFLHHEVTPSWARAVYIPGVTTRAARYIPYYLLRHNKLVPSPDGETAKERQY